MVPTRFAWPYGGHQVFLHGSFIRGRNLRMMPVEGSSTVFQAICNLAPGYHQYKFLVDGVWRHDEQQPYVTDEYGTVNNVILVREPEFVPSALLPEVPVLGMTNMHNGVYRHDPLLGGIHQEPMTWITDAKEGISRSRLSILLSRYTTYELLPDSGKVSAVEVNVPVKQAFNIMYEQGLAVVPLWDDCKGQFSGMLTASDFILILTKLHTNGSMLTSEELEMHTISAWKEEKLQMTRKSRGSEPPFRRPLVQAQPELLLNSEPYHYSLPGLVMPVHPTIVAGPNESLKDVAMRILQNEISVVPIIHSSEGSCPQLLHLACLPGILKYMCRHFKHSTGWMELLQQPIYSIALGTWIPEISRGNGRQLAIIRSNAPLSSALSLLMEAQISSIPIVDDNGSLLDVYSRSDITALAIGGAYAQIRLDQTSILQALQLGYKANDVIIGPRRCQMCLRSDSLHEIMEHLSDPVVRRVVAVEAGSKRVEGIITLRDIFNYLLR